MRRTCVAVVVLLAACAGPPAPSARPTTSDPAATSQGASPAAPGVVGSRPEAIAIAAAAAPEIRSPIALEAVRGPVRAVLRSGSGYLRDVELADDREIWYVILSDGGASLGASGVDVIIDAGTGEVLAEYVWME